MKKTPYFVMVTFLACTTLHAAECAPGEKSEVLQGRLAFAPDWIGTVPTMSTPYYLETPGSKAAGFYAVQPTGPYFGMEPGTEGFQKNMAEKLDPILGRPVIVDGCTGVEMEDFYWVGNIAGIELA
jgi:hypothetical protein